MNMSKYEVLYSAGPSRYEIAKDIDYMLVVVPNADGEMVELYAEEINPTWNEDEECLEDGSYTYDSLREQIIHLAEQNRVDTKQLIFYYD